MRLAPSLAGALALLALAPAAAGAAELKRAGTTISYSDPDPGDRNSVTVVASGDRIALVERGTQADGRPVAVTSDGSCTLGSSGTRPGGSCAGSGVTAIEVTLGAQNDGVRIAVAIAARLDGGPGDDTLIGGDGGDVLVGGPGADTLIGWRGSDVADYGDRTAALTISMDGRPGDGEAGENDNVGSDVEELRAGSGNDVLLGNGLPNVIRGGPGDDVLDGGGRSDVLDGGDGFDRASYALSPAPVRVTLDGLANDGNGGDRDLADVEGVIGSAYADVLIGNAGANSLEGGAGDDRLWPGGGDDRVQAGEGADLVHALDGARDEVDCGGGDDRALGDGGDSVTGCESLARRALAPTARRVRAVGGYVRVPFRCSLAAVLGCNGGVSLRVGGRSLGTRGYALTRGRLAGLRFRLPPALRRALASRGRLRATLVGRDVGGGAPVVARGRLRIRD